MSYGKFASGLIASILTVGTGTAQVAPGHTVVLSEVTGGPAASALFDVDPATGIISQLPRFTPDHWRPLAVAVDPITGDIVVALSHPINLGSALFRLRIAGTTLTSTAIGGTPFGTINDLAFGTQGDLFAAWEHPSAVGGGILWRFNRGQALGRQVSSFRGSLTAMELPSLQNYATIVESSAGVTQLGIIDLTTGRYVTGPATVPGLANRRVTGVHDLPTGAIRQVVADSTGQIHLFEFGAQVRTLTLNPALPAGGATALKGDGIDAMVLGNASHPQLIRVTVFGASAGSWQQIAGPFPGSPIDFARAPASGARVVTFGASCHGPGTIMDFTWFGQPTIGNAQFSIGMGSTRTRANAVIALGLSSPVVALALPRSGCLLQVSTEALINTSTDGRGQATLPLPIPNQPALVGARVFGQWVVTSASASLEATPAAAILIGR